MLTGSVLFVTILLLFGFGFGLLPLFVTDSEDCLESGAGGLDLLRE
jgi:hypothetical protein